MHDPQGFLSSLRRPRLLVRAAHLGLQDYRRERCLKRLMPGETPPKPGMALETLADREHDIDTLRRSGDASYSVARHIELRIALIDEASLAEQRAPSAKAA